MTENPQTSRRSTTPEEPFFRLEIEEVDVSRKRAQPRNTGQMDQNQCNQVINAIQRNKGFDTPTKAFTIITGLCQVGGTNRNAGSRVSYVYDGKTLNGQEFATFCTQAGGTPRQFARTMASVISRVALKLEEPGDLSRQMRLDHPNLTLEDAVWCSNFQSQNPDCPEPVQIWLSKNYKRRFTD